jgi:hypothetical protein
MGKVPGISVGLLVGPEKSCGPKKLQEKILFEESM